MKDQFNTSVDLNLIMKKKIKKNHIIALASKLKIDTVTLIKDYKLIDKRRMSVNRYNHRRQRRWAAEDL